MSEVKIRVYYQYDGPSHSSPLRRKLPDDDVVRNLRLLPDDLSHTLDESAQIEVTHEDYGNQHLEIRIRANCREKELLSVVEAALRNADLYGERI